jgi:hypothetical protein
LRIIVAQSGTRIFALFSGLCQLAQCHGTIRRGLARMEAHMGNWRACWVAAAAISAWATPALAQDEPSGEKAEEGAETADEAAGEGTEAKDEAKKEEPKAEETAPADAAGNSPVEEPGKTYRFVGLRYRGIIIPKFMMNLFGDGGRTTYNHAFGPEFTIRKDAFEYVFSLWWAGYHMKDTPFKASSDGNDAWEIVKSNLNVIFLTSDFLWSSEVSPEFAINYGMGAGFGIVFGSLERTQAYPGNGNANLDPYEWEKCTAAGNPDPTFCGGDNNHYNGYTEPSWADGGSKPIIFPWLVAQTGLRYKASKQFVARLDLGFGTSGFFFGLGANYGL